MAEDKKVDYSKVRTVGGVTTDEDGVAVATAVSDGGREAHVNALKAERELLAQRVEADDEDKRAKSRLAAVDKELDRFKARPSQATKETAARPQS